MYKKRIVIALAVIAALALLHFSGLQEYFTIDQLKSNKEYLTQIINERYVQSVLVFIAIYIAIAGTTIPLAGFMTVAGGFLFGVVPGVIYSNIGATIGATFSFLISRYIFGTWLQRRYAHKLVKFNKVLSEQGAMYLLSLHLVALVPFFIINILAGLTNVPLLTFVWTTAVGIIPGSFVFAFAGSQLQTIEKMGDILSWNVLLAFGFLALLSLIPLIIRRLRGGSSDLV